MRRSLAKAVSILMASVVVSACSYFVSWEDSVKGGVGRSIDSIVELDGPPTAVITLPGGKKEYKYHFKKIDPTCIHYWIVNPQGVITGYRYEGRCRPIG